MIHKTGNSHLFLAYHIRSAALLIERNWQVLASEKKISIAQFYILQCDWKEPGISLAEIISHSLLQKNETIEALENLVERGFISERPTDNTFTLSNEGKKIRDQLSHAFRGYISKITEGISDGEAEAVLSTLLSLQDKAHRNEIIDRT